METDRLPMDSRTALTFVLRLETVPRQPSRRKDSGAVALTEVRIVVAVLLGIDTTTSSTRM
jgi:hypothetical protein